MRLDKIFSNWKEVESGLKADGLLTAMCRKACVADLPHGFEISKGRTRDLIAFWYTEDEEEKHLEWCEEVSMKEER